MFNSRITGKKKKKRHYQ